MSKEEPFIRNVSDTAFWIAAYRAQESARPDAHFDDPYAARLAGERGRQIITSDRYLASIAWPFIARTYLLDNMVDQHISIGGDMVINLAAGLDSRPYRLNLPPELKWIEVDLPDILDYKQGILADAEPNCKLEQIRQDLSQVEERKALFKELGERAKNALVITEGLLLYLTPDAVTDLARDLYQISSFQKWAMDLISEGIARMVNKGMKISLTEAGAPFQFYPDNGVHYFEPLGWQAIEVHSQLKVAARLERLPLGLRLMSSILPTPKPPFGRYKRWSCICLFEKTRKPQ